MVLFDEIEKAHPDVFNMLLQILEDGILTDSQGRRVDFKNAVIIMTSNIGARMITEHKSLGFADGEKAQEEQEDYEAIKSDVLGELKRHFKPEFLNRVDDIIVFHKLTQENIQQIARNMLGTLVSRVKKLEIDLSVSDAAVEKIAQVGFDDTYGARPLRRAITSQIEDKMSEQMLEGSIKAGTSVLLDVKDGEFVFIPQNSAPPQEQSKADA